VRAAQGVNIMAFCKEYNAATQDKVGTIIPVEITVYEVPPCCCCLSMSCYRLLQHMVWWHGVAICSSPSCSALPHAALLCLQKWLPRRRAAEAAAPDTRRTGASRSS